MKTYRGVEDYRYTFLTSALDGEEWSASRPGCFTPEEKVPSIHWMGTGMGGTPEMGLNAVEKNLLPLLGIELRFLGRPPRRLVAIFTGPALKSL
jgi:hypothetical protein